ncbi:MAG: hypothetical protein KDA84_06915 [Planctomycetaceae bacterium]|nr:hypothetical protein [Planctomycetaceae bacterium]
MYSGLKQLQGIRVRWQDLDAGKDAYKLLLDFDRQRDRPWEKDDVAEQRRFLIARARGLDAYGSGPLPQKYLKSRPNLLKAAIKLWEQVVLDGQEETAVQEAKSRIPKLQLLLKESE